MKHIRIAGTMMMRKKSFWKLRPTAISSEARKNILVTT